MKKNRKLSTLYALLLKVSDKVELKTRGICCVISTMYYDFIITEDEYDLLSNHFSEQRPSEDKYPEFFYPNKNKVNSAYWWRCKLQLESEKYKDSEIAKCPKTIRSRFISHLIKVCREEEKLTKN